MHIIAKKLRLKRLPDNTKDAIRVYRNYLYPEHIPDREAKRISDAISMLNDMKIQKGRWVRAYKKGTYVTKTRDVLDIKKTEIIEWFGEYKDSAEIQRLIYKKWKHNVSAARLRSLYSENRKKIEDLRSEYEKTNGYIKLANQRGRLEEYAYIYDTQRQKYEDSDYAVPHTRPMLEVLDKIKKEIDGEKIVLDIQGKIDVDMTMNVNKSFQQVTSQIPMMSFIVALAASKRGIAPDSIMSKLQSSIYKGYSGVSGFWDGEKNQDLSILPSNQVYDWLKASQERVEDVEHEEIKIDVEEEKKEEVNEVRQKMLDTLKARMNGLENITDNE